MLTNSQQKIIINTYHYVKEKLLHDYSGHDIAHIERVVNLAKQIQITEPHSNQFIVIISAYLHDVIDDKVVENSQSARQELTLFMQQQSLSQQEQQVIWAIIDNMSYRKNLSEKKLLTIEGKIVQDADRLDAIGAIGIARTFYYGSNKKNIMYDPAIPPRSEITEDDYRRPNTVINHFYEKLFLLKDQMNTNEGKKQALERHQFLVEFVKHFKNEWQNE